MNDSTVPMDIGRARNHPFRGGGQARGQLALTDPPKTRGACFNCREEGHFARNCPRKGRNRVNLIDFEEDPYEGPPPKDRVATLKAELSAMTLQEKEQLAQTIQSKIVAHLVPPTCTNSRKSGTTRLSAEETSKWVRLTADPPKAT